MTYDKFREQFRELIEQDGMYTIAQLDQSLLEGHSQFWGAENAAMVTGIVHYDGGQKIGQVDWVVGSLDEIIQIMPKAEAWMKAQGCTKIMFEGRVGWQRVLKRHGYRPHSITVVKTI